MKEVIGGREKGADKQNGKLTIDIMPHKTAWKLRQRQNISSKHQSPDDKAKLKMQYWPSNTTSGNLYQKYTDKNMLLVIAKDQKQHKYSSPEERLNKIWYLHPMDSYAEIKSNRNFSLHRQVDACVHVACAKK